MFPWKQGAASIVWPDSPRPRRWQRAKYDYSPYCILRCQSKRCIPRMHNCHPLHKRLSITLAATLHPAIPRDSILLAWCHTNYHHSSKRVAVISLRFVLFRCSPKPGHVISMSATVYKLAFCNDCSTASCSLISKLYRTSESPHIFDPRCMWR